MILQPRLLSITTRCVLLNSPRTPKTEAPILGFGVYASPSDKCSHSVKTAIQNGYRHIDTAQFYENEAEVGEGMRLSGVPREELFIVTNVRRISGGKGRWEGGDGYVDLFLIHGPTVGPEGRKAMWQALEKLMEEGGTREIGVSNFGAKHIEQLLSYAKYKPVINQIELHPWCPQPFLAQFCTKHCMLLQAYSPLAHATRWNDPTISAIARAHNSDTESRIKGNADVFEFKLNELEMAKIAELGKGLEDGQAATCPYNIHCE
ncbi:NADP-dependent oxidoreductase domain-containing protein [Tirmania nivea]|nr:NADP-dependent oxidoreductase domain-containing protein [Tirmania nivea]